MLRKVIDLCDRWPLPAWGCLALVLYAIHGGWHLLSIGQPYELLWACHLGNMAVVIGLLTKCRWLNAVGTLILFVGLPLWFINLFTGGRLIFTSPVMHVGGPLMGLVGIYRLGLPDRDWLIALVLITFVILLCLVATPYDQNINLAHHEWKPLEVLGVPPQFRIAFLLARWVVLLSTTELMLCWILRKAKWDDPATSALTGNLSLDRLSTSSQ
ncbi:MAG: hypothetical protein WBF93_17560 [Pirellulales bacterium]